MTDGGGQGGVAHKLNVGIWPSGAETPTNITDREGIRKEESGFQFPGVPEKAAPMPRHMD